MIYSRAMTLTSGYHMVPIQTLFSCDFMIGKNEDPRSKLWHKQQSGQVHIIFVILDLIILTTLLHLRNIKPLTNNPEMLGLCRLKPTKGPTFVRYNWVLSGWLLYSIRQPSVYIQYRHFDIHLDRYLAIVIQSYSWVISKKVAYGFIPGKSYISLF